MDLDVVDQKVGGKKEWCRWNCGIGEFGNDDDDVGDDRDGWGIDMNCIDWVMRWRQNMNLEVVELKLDDNGMLDRYEWD